MKYKVLFIDNSPLLLNFMKEYFSPYFDVIIAKDGLDGLIKMRNQIPDLIVMDVILSKLNGLDFLNEKNSLKGTKDIPVIILSARLKKETIVKLGKFNINKILSKPIQIDLLTTTITNILKLNLPVDKTECKIDVHLNDDILFIEVNSGLNIDKIKIMKYKILELKTLYENNIYKILLIISKIANPSNFEETLNFLMENIIETTKAPIENINVLTLEKKIIDFFKYNLRFSNIKIVEDFETAIENLGKIELLYSNESDIDTMKKNIITGNNIPYNESEIDLKFSDEKIKEEKANEDKKYNIAIIDDDLPILELMENILTSDEINVLTYENGKVFIEDYNKIKFDLIFLDILMPIMNGFEVLDYLKAQNSNVPIVVLTALADKESILKARKYGINSYLTKPANIKYIKHKVEEILTSNF